MIAAARAARSLLLAAAATALLLVAAAAWSEDAHASSCGGQADYPGDAATSAEFANWMARGAIAARIPGELPVMAALVESGLRNLPYGDSDSIGFFQMRKSIWNTGKYKGYLKNPQLQLQWFLDQAASVRAGKIASGKGDPAAGSASYGEWIADIERPAARYRGRYQPRLKEAQDLIAKSCPALVGINVLAPISHLQIKSRQHPGRSGAIAVRVRCPKAACLAAMSVQFRLPARRGVIKLASDTTMLAAGRKAKVAVEVPLSLRRSIRKRLRRGMTARARLRISVAGVSGAATVRVRRIVLAR